MFDVLIIGCGPTGIAALAECKANGLKAVGIEMGNKPLSNISKYPDGLVFFSPAEQFQIFDIPLDCKNRKEVSKEEVLFYYSRLINRYRLNIKCNYSFVGIKECQNGLEVLCRTENGVETINTKRVIFTAWFNINEVKLESIKETKVKIYYHFNNAIEFAGKRVIIIGSGISACEACVFLMMSGQQIRLLLRGKKNDWHNNKSFKRLLEITESEVIEEALDIRVHESGICMKKDDETYSFDCEAIIICAGQALNVDSLNIFREFNVIDKELFSQLCKVEPYSKILRKRKTTTLTSQALLEETIKNWPDLQRYVTTGIKGVYFAGSILHVGASAAGIRVSINTAISVVKFICNRDSLAIIKSPAPTLGQNLVKENSHFIDMSAILDIKPYPVKSWTRNTFSVSVLEDDYGMLSTKTESSYYLGSKKDRLIKKIFRLSNGDNSIRDILQKCCDTEEDVKKLVLLLYHLFYHNGLTWFPDTFGFGAPK